MVHVIMKWHPTTICCQIRYQIILPAPPGSYHQALCLVDVNYALTLLQIRCIVLQYNAIIDQSYKSHNTFDKYPTMCHFETEMCTNVHILLQNGALRDMGLVHCGIWDWCIVGYGTGALRDMEWCIVGYGTGALWDCEFSLSVHQDKVNCWLCWMSE